MPERRIVVQPASPRLMINVGATIEMAKLARLERDWRAGALTTPDALTALSAWLRRLAG